MRYSATHFGHTADGTAATLHTVRNHLGARLSVCDYGATVVALDVADRNGTIADVVLGYDSVHAYEQCQAYIGCIVGRVANRIACGRFTLDGQRYQLRCNDGIHHLHGAGAGLHRRFWKVRYQAGALVCSVDSEHGDGGYPGSVSIQVSYHWGQDSQLRIDYQASTDRPTIVNLSSHGYFNLAGHDRAGCSGALDHELQLFADHYVPTDAHSIPLNRLDPVRGTPMDFLQSTTVGASIDSAFEQTQNAVGYDHCWAIAQASGADPVLAAQLMDPVSGRRMRVSTTQPGVQFYSANHLGDVHGKGGHRYAARGALCLETQHFPDAINQPAFASIVLRPGQRYRHQTCFSFDCI